MYVSTFELNILENIKLLKLKNLNFFVIESSELKIV